LSPVKIFKVFGEPVEVLVSGEMTGGLSTTLTQTSPPGGGPPPHLHLLEGEYEFLRDGEWHAIAPGETVLAKRGSVHTFRNAGTTTGKILVFVTPAGMDKYLEEISPLTIPQDMAELLAISERYGISFPM
jgi:hypothetical protein